MRALLKLKIRPTQYFVWFDTFKFKQWFLQLQCIPIYGKSTACFSKLEWDSCSQTWRQISISLHALASNMFHSILIQSCSQSFCTWTQTNFWRSNTFSLPTFISWFKDSCYMWFSWEAFLIKSVTICKCHASM